MINCLVFETEPNCSIYLTKEKDLNVIIATSEKEIITKYKILFPDVFIIDIDNNISEVVSILNQITIDSAWLPYDDIIIIYSDKSIFKDIKLSKVYTCISKSHISELLLNSILIIANQKNQIWYDTDSLHQRVYNLQHKMNLADNTIGVSYLRKAVRVCYREPKYANKLSTIYKRVSYEFKEQAEKNNGQLDNEIIEKFDCEKIRWDIAKTVKLYQNDFKKNENIIHNLFGNNFYEDDITPKKLIQAMVKYLRINVDSK